MSTIPEFLPVTTVQPSVSQLLVDRRSGYMLPPGFYLQPDVFEADLDLMFRRQWLFVGVAADVPEAGDTLTVEVAQASVMIVRGDDDEIRAFHNVCCHRASRILEPGSWSVAKLVCPYHQWTYDLDGRLLFAKTMGKDFDPAAYHLKAVNLRVIGGLLFVCLADETPKGIEELARVMEPRLAPYELGNAKVAFELSIVEECNWKLTMENNRECYHCALGHPELIRSYPPAALGYDVESLSGQEKKDAETYLAKRKAQMTEWESAGVGSNYVGTAGPDDDTYFSSERYLIGNGDGESGTMDTKVACDKLLGMVPHKQMGDLNLWTHTSWHHFFSDHAVTIFVTPLSPSQTRVTTKWLVPKDAVEGKDYDLANLTRVWQATNHEDSIFVARQQHGVADPGYVPGPYSKVMEGYVEKFLDWYIGRLHSAGY